jgi:hypothetical protein
LDKNSCTLSQIDDLIVQFHNLKSKASKLRDDLYSINEKLLTGNYIQQDLLNELKNSPTPYGLVGEVTERQDYRIIVE